MGVWRSLSQKRRASVRRGELNVDLFGVNRRPGQSDVYAMKCSTKGPTRKAKLPDFGKSEGNRARCSGAGPVRTARVGIQAGRDVYGQDGTGSVPERIDRARDNPAGAAPNPGTK